MKKLMGFLAVFLFAASSLHAEASSTYQFAQAVLNTLPLISWSAHFSNWSRIPGAITEDGQPTETRLHRIALQRMVDLKMANNWLEDVKGVMTQHMGVGDPSVRMAAQQIYSSAEMLMKANNVQVREMRKAAAGQISDPAQFALSLAETNREIKSRFLILLQSAALVSATVRQAEGDAMGRPIFRINADERIALAREIESRFSGGMPGFEGSSSDSETENKILSIARNIKARLQP